jgi:hypothetical protein
MKLGVEHVANIGSVLGTANAAAAAPTTEVLAAGADDVSAAVAELLSGHAPFYQTLAARPRVSRPVREAAG